MHHPKLDLTLSHSIKRVKRLLCLSSGGIDPSRNRAANSILRQYDVTGCNCQHFGTWCKFGEGFSPQTNTTTGAFQAYDPMGGFVANAMREGDAIARLAAVDRAAADRELAKGREKLREMDKEGYLLEIGRASCRERV